MKKSLLALLALSLLWLALWPITPVIAQGVLNLPLLGRMTGLYPPSDSTTAFRIFKADASTAVVDVDTSNSRVGIGKTPSVPLDVNGAIAGSSIAVSGNVQSGSANYLVIGARSTIASSADGVVNLFKNDGVTPAVLSANGVLSAGTKFTTSGCAVSATTGGATAGTYTSGTTGTCTVVITMNGATGLTAANGWACSASDRTTPADIQQNTASNTTTATISGTTASGDVVSFQCTGY